MEPITPFGWLKLMPTNLQDSVLQRAKLYRIEAGAPIYLQGEDPRGLYGLAEGILEVSIVQSSGEPSLIYLARRGWWFGALEIFTKGPRRFQIEARTDCDLLFLSGNHVREICRLAPDNWEAFAQLMCFNYESVTAGLAMMRHASPDLRVAKALLILYHRQTETEEVIEATQSDIASVANVSVRAAAAALARLEKDGLVARGYATVTILDPDRLLRMAGSDTE